MRNAMLISTLLAVAAIPAGADCEHREPRNATVPADGAVRLMVDAEAGSLEIVGVAGLREVRVSGTACASDRDLLERIRLETERRDDEIRVRAITPDGDSWGWGRDEARLDLVIEAPPAMLVDVDDGSGSLRVEGVAAVRIDDGSGEILVRRVGGAVRIDDGSGSIEVEEVGELDVRDGSGEIVAERIAGDVVVEDGSGSIELVGIGGDVLVREDGSGSMRIEQVAGSVRVRDDGSGSISVADVVGDLTVDDDGSGGIDVRGVQGRVTIPDD